MALPAHPQPATVGQLRSSGYQPRTTKQELRANLLRRLGSDEVAIRTPARTAELSPPKTSGVVRRIDAGRREDVDERA